MGVSTSRCSAQQSLKHCTTSTILEAAVVIGVLVTLCHIQPPETPSKTPQTVFIVNSSPSGVRL